MKDISIANRIYFYIVRKILSNSKFYNFWERYLDTVNGNNLSNIYINGEWRFMNQNLKKCEVVFDIGANIGNWTKYALAVNENLKIHCFEPSKWTYKKLIKNNFPSNVICNNFGLSSIKGEKVLYILEQGSAGNSLYQKFDIENEESYILQDKTELIKLDTLNNYCKENNIEQIDFMKIDAEGHDYEVLKGGKNLIENRQVNIIQFEYGGCNIDSRVFLKDFFEFFDGMSYNFYKIYPDCVKHIERYDYKLENFKYQNWLVIEKGYRFNQ